MHLALANSLGTGSGMAVLPPQGNGLPPDEKAYLNLTYIYLPRPRASVNPSTGLAASANILHWCPGNPPGLELIYRASQAGRAAPAFNVLLADTTILRLFRVSPFALHRVATAGPGSRDSVECEDFLMRPGPP